MVVTSSGGALHLLRLILAPPWQWDAGDRPSQASVAPTDLIASSDARVLLVQALGSSQRKRSTSSNSQAAAGEFCMRCASTYDPDAYRALMYGAYARRDI